MADDAMHRELNCIVNACVPSYKNSTYAAFTEHARLLLDMRKKYAYSYKIRALKGGESSSQFQWFTIAKIEL